MTTLFNIILPVFVLAGPGFDAGPLQLIAPYSAHLRRSPAIRYALLRRSNIMGKLRLIAASTGPELIIQPPSFTRFRAPQPVFSLIIFLFIMSFPCRAERH